MQAALNNFRDMLDHPDLKGFCAALGMILCALVRHAPDAAVFAILASFVLWVFDLALGATRASVERRFDRSKLGLSFVKLLVYAGVIVVAAVVGMLADLAVGSDGYLVYSGIVTSTTLLVVGTEALSVLDHADALTGGKLQLTALRGLLDKIREGKADA